MLDKTYRQEDLNQFPLKQGVYENCNFIGCDFSEYNLSHFKFIDCEFNACNLSLVKLHNTALQSVKFTDCKLLGLLFDACNDFGFSVSFDSCQLTHSSFYKVILKNTIFKDSQLTEVDFSSSDLSNARFENCNLSLAIFNETILFKTDFRTANKYSIDPERNRVKKAKFSIPNVVGLLDKYDIEIDEF